jgi:hypothetical protein
MSYFGFQGHLVTITSAEENAFVFSLSPNNNFWIAGSDAQQEGVWRWVAGPELGQIINPTFWGSGEPTSGWDDDYVRSVSSSRWGAYTSSSQSSYIVEYECSFMPPPGSPCARMPS